MSETRWCSHCREELTSSYDEQGNCLWCGNPTRKKAAPRLNRRGSRYSEAELRELHKLHRDGATLRSLAQRTYEHLGYASHEAAEKAIKRDWRRRGWWIRSRSENNTLLHYKHGCSRMPGEYKWRRRVLGGDPYRPICKAIAKSGRPCRRPSLQESEFCHSHDPVKGKESREHLARARRHHRAALEQVPTGPFANWLQKKRREAGGWQKLGELLNRDPSNLYRYLGGSDKLKSRRQTIGRTTVESYLEIDADTTFSDLYPDHTGAT